jgi:hypothetical protein
MHGLLEALSSKKHVSNELGLVKSKNATDAFPTQAASSFGHEVFSFVEGTG